jgi:hypothetical protein
MTNNNNNDFGGGRVYSSTGLFSMEAPTRIYSSTGLFSTNETRMYGKWGRRLLTGAALLGGAALANHALGDPWGIGAKVADTAKGAWNVLNGKTSNAVVQGAKNVVATSQAKNITDATAKAISQANKNAKAEQASKTKQTVNNGISNIKAAPVLARAAYAEKYGDLSSKVAVAKELESLIPTARAEGNQRLADELYNTMRRLNPMPNGTHIISGEQVSANVQQQQLDMEEMNKFVPLSKELVDTLQSQWDKIVDGDKNIKPLALANNAKTALDSIKAKYDRAKKNNWPKSTKAYLELYNTLKLVYNNAADAAQARQEMGK